ncbi:hypothetical protein LTR29_007953 [Friedmanniomyces endolithicus]|nr:hypothetical protein LTR29_007953 [Friedmanniomyces endolithicus]
MSHSALFLVLGASGGTGKHFVSQVLADGHRVRALVRTPEKLAKLVGDNNRLEVWPGSITDETIDTDKLVKGVDYVVSMLGDVNAQRTAKINTTFVKRLVPSMRQSGVRRFLYQAGGLSRPYQGQLSPLLWGIRYTLARGYAGQHEDNEAVMEYLATEGNDMEWIVHRAGIGSDGPSKGVLERSKSFSVATFVDCATYSYRLVMDDSAVHRLEVGDMLKLKRHFEDPSIFGLNKTAIRIQKPSHIILQLSASFNDMPARNVAPPPCILVDHRVS